MNRFTLHTFMLLLLAVAGLQAQEPPASTTDCWQERVNVNGTAPSARSFHTAVWTGSEMIIWGGLGGSDTGGRFNPTANIWSTVTTTGAPAGRYWHTAVWTGSEMIVWGGTDDFGVLNTGARFNPAENSWTAVSATGAPAARYLHTAVWTGSEMIVWGGWNVSSNFSTGGRYLPSENSWTPVTVVGAPSARNQHTAVWTGNEMIVWGGTGGSTSGARYNPASDSWTAVSPTGGPGARVAATAVWTGREMIVWGGTDSSGRIYFNSGARYNPAENNWISMSVAGAPAARNEHTAVWTGSGMVVWGGYYFDGSSHYLNDGGRYNPLGNSWTAMSTNGAPAARKSHTAVWTGSEMIVWGGSNVGSGPFTDTFSYLPDCDPFRISSAVLDDGNLMLSFLTVTGRTYTLWRSDTLTSGPWTNTGLPALTGTGSTLTFTIPVPAAGVLKRFFRVQADP